MGATILICYLKKLRIRIKQRLGIFKGTLDFNMNLRPCSWKLPRLGLRGAELFSYLHIFEIVYFTYDSGLENFSIFLTILQNIILK